MFGASDVAGSWNTFVPGWTVSGSAGDFRPTPSPGLSVTPYEGNNVAFVGVGTISQSITVDPNTSYTFTVAVWRQEQAAASDYTVALYLAGVKVAEYDGTTNTTAWAPTSVSAVTGSTIPGQLELQLTAKNGQVLFDDVRLSANSVSTPEPATYSLIGGALLGLGVFLRRRSR